ncbi:MAG: tRNA glutamyl-Q(34) synthetase GluQRS [Ilumatobacteraceae bacterium]|nr:tRNA glutamyl-Q(34) synthetase GluQRS [Ilumatobacteraceae bacterium]
MRGRFAPSPTGQLHLGNLRTALVSWLQVKAAEGQWWVRMEDLDRVTASVAHEAGQLKALAALGMQPDGEVVRQSDRFDLYRDAIATLHAQGRVYECFCTRREIREAAQAPHGNLPEVAYPGTCRHLTAAQRAEFAADGRRPALRLAAHDERFVVHDLIAGSFSGASDDVVLRRTDGVPAYNLAVVVDDGQQGITHVTRGDDLLTSTPRQRLLQDLLGLSEPKYAHVPLVLAPDGARLAKRHGAVTLDDLAARGVGPEQVLSRLAASLGLCAPDEVVTLVELVSRFRIDALTRVPWSLNADDL